MKRVIPLLLRFQRAEHQHQQLLLGAAAAQQPAAHCACLLQHLPGARLLHTPAPHSAEASSFAEAATESRSARAALRLSHTASAAAQQAPPGAGGEQAEQLWQALAALASDSTHGLDRRRLARQAEPLLAAALPALSAAQCAAALHALHAARHKLGRATLQAACSRLTAALSEAPPGQQLTAQELHHLTLALSAHRDCQPGPLTDRLAGALAAQVQQLTPAQQMQLVDSLAWAPGLWRRRQHTASVQPLALQLATAVLATADAASALALPQLRSLARLCGLAQLSGQPQLLDSLAQAITQRLSSAQGQLEIPQGQRTPAQPPYAVPPYAAVAIALSFQQLGHYHLGLCDAVASALLAASNERAFGVADTARLLAAALALARQQHDRARLTAVALTSADRCLVGLPAGAVVDMVELQSLAAGDSRVHRHVGGRAMRQLLDRSRIHLEPEVQRLSMEQLARVMTAYARADADWAADGPAGREGRGEQARAGGSGSGSGAAGGSSSSSAAALHDAIAAAAVSQLQAPQRGGQQQVGGSLVALLRGFQQLGPRSPAVSALFEAAAGLVMAQGGGTSGQEAAQVQLQPLHQAQLAAVLLEEGELAPLQPMLDALSQRLCENGMLDQLPPCDLGLLLQAHAAAGYSHGGLLSAVAERAEREAAAWPVTSLAQALPVLVRHSLASRQLLDAAATQMQQHLEDWPPSLGNALADALLATGTRHPPLLSALADLLCSQLGKLPPATAVRLLHALRALGMLRDPVVIRTVAQPLARTAAQLDLDSWLQLLETIALSGAVADGAVYDALGEAGQKKLSAATTPDQLLRAVEAFSAAGAAPAIFNSLHRYCLLQASRFEPAQAIRLLLALFQLGACELRTFRGLSLHLSRVAGHADTGDLLQLLRACLDARRYHDMLFCSAATAWLDEQEQGQASSAAAAAAEMPCQHGAPADDAVAVATALGVCSQDSKAPIAERLARLLAGGSWLAQMGAHQVAETAWYLAFRSGVQHPGFMDACASRILSLQGQAPLDGHLQLRLLEAYATAGHPHPGLLASLKAAALPYLTAAPPALVSTLAWACAKLGDNDAGVFEAAAERVRTLPTEQLAFADMLRLAEAHLLAGWYPWTVFEKFLASSDAEPLMVEDADALQQGAEVFGALGSEQAVQASGDERLRELRRIARKCANRLKALESRRIRPARDYDQRLF